MIFKNSLKSILRARVRTIFFCAMTIFLTLLLCLSGGLWYSSNEMMDRCQKSYSTIAVVKYMESMYPDIGVYDEVMQQKAESLDDEAISNYDEVLLWERINLNMGIVEGYNSPIGEKPYGDAFIAVISDIFGQPTPGMPYYTAIMDYALYGSEGKNISIFIDAGIVNTLDIKMERHTKYIVIGNTVRRGGGTYLMPKVIMNKAAGDRISSIKMVQKLDDEYDIENSAYMDMAKYLDIINRWVSVYPTDDSLSLEEFNQSDIYIMKGRSYTREEAEEGKRVCIVTENMTQTMNLDVGDKIKLSLLPSQQGLPMFESWWDTVVPDGEEYEIVGVTSSTLETCNNIYIPRKLGLESKTQHGYTLGRAVLKNGTPEEFQKHMSSYLTDRTRMIVYDQGYSAAAGTIQMVGNTAMVIAISCGAVGLVVLFIYSFLFIWKRKENMLLLHDLGTPRHMCYAWMLDGACAVYAISTAIGIGLSMLLQKAIAALVFSAASQSFESDMRYSNIGAEAKKAFDFTLSSNPLIFIGIGILAILISTLFSLVFCIKADLENAPHRRNQRRKKKSRKGAGNTPMMREGKSANSCSGALAFSLLSIKRGGLRTLTVPLITIAMAFLLGQVVRISQGWRSQLKDIYDSTTIEGYYTNSTGRVYSGLSIRNDYIQELSGCGYVKDVEKTYRGNYTVMSRTSHSTGDEKVFKQIEVPEQDSFGWESLYSVMIKEPSLVYADGIKAMDEFFYADDIEIIFMEGKDESIFNAQSTEYESTGCVEVVVPETILEEYEAELGDTLNLFTLIDCYGKWFSYPYFRPTKVKIVGYYPVLGPQTTIVAPLCYLQEIIWNDVKGYSYKLGINKKENALKYFRYNTGRFTVADNRKLGEFKEWLYKEGYSSVGGMRGNKYATIMIEDKTFTETVGELNRYIGYTNAAIIVINIIIGVLGGIVSYLMAAGRKNEFIIMRELGVPKVKILLSFLWEQAFLCIAGCTIMGIIYASIGMASLPMAVCMTAFCIIYVAGSAISIKILEGAESTYLIDDERK